MWTHMDVVCLFRAGSEIGGEIIRGRRISVNIAKLPELLSRRQTKIPKSMKRPAGIVTQIESSATHITPAELNGESGGRCGDSPSG